MFIGGFSMSSLEIIDVIRKIVEHELRKLHIAEIGVVTSVFPRSSESDKNNYECNVKLKYRDLELRRVPVATQHIGLANIPHVGDLVLVTFVHGNVNAPVIIGRLYTDEDRPPTSKEEEIVYIPPYSKSSDLRRIYLELPSGLALTITDDKVEVEAGKTVIAVDRDGSVKIKSNSSISIEAKGNLTISANSIKMKSKQLIEMESNMMNVKMEKSDLDIKMLGVKNTNFNLEAQTLVSIKSSATLNIEGSIGNIKMSGPLTIKGAVVNIN